MANLLAKLQAFAEGTYMSEPSPKKTPATNGREEPTASPIDREVHRRRQQPSLSSPIDKEAVRRAGQPKHRSPSSPVDREAAQRKRDRPPSQRPKRAAPLTPGTKHQEVGEQGRQRLRSSREELVGSEGVSLSQPLPQEHVRVSSPPRRASPKAADDSGLTAASRPAKKKSKSNLDKTWSASSEPLIHSQSLQGSQGDEDGIRLNPVFVTEAIAVDSNNPLFQELEADAWEHHGGDTRRKENAPRQERYTFSDPDPGEEEAYVVENELANLGQFQMPPAEGDEGFILEPPTEYSQDSDGPFEFLANESYDTSRDGEGERAAEGRGDQDGHFTSLSHRSKKRLKAHQELEATERSVMGAGSPVWEPNEYQYDQYDQFDRDALEEDDVPNVVLDDEVAALIW